MKFKIKKSQVYDKLKSFTKVLKKSKITFLNNGLGHIQQNNNAISVFKISIDA